MAMAPDHTPGLRSLEVKAVLPRHPLAMILRIRGFNSNNELAIVDVTETGIRPVVKGDSDHVRVGETIVGSDRAPFFSPKAFQTTLAGRIAKWLKNRPPRQSSGCTVILDSFDPRPATPGGSVTTGIFAPQFTSWKCS